MDRIKLTTTEIVFTFLIVILSENVLANIKDCIDITEKDRLTVGFRCQTSQNGVFERVEYKGFGVAWKDSDGNIWSGVIKGKYKNTDLDGVKPIFKLQYGQRPLLPEFNRIRKSRAIEGCKSAGGELPPILYLDNLADWFEQGSEFEYSDNFTEKGKQEFQNLFPEMSDTLIWSSTLYDQSKAYAFTVQGDFPIDRAAPGAMICLKEPEVEIIKPIRLKKSATDTKNCAEITDEERLTIGFQCKTSKEKVLERVEYKNFGVAWKVGYPEAENPDIWSGAIKEKYDNADLDGIRPLKYRRTGNIQKSHATEACKAIGGRLPSPSDYGNLLTSFGTYAGRNDRYNGLRISEQGTHELYRIFPKMQFQWFWTSSIDEYSPTYVFFARYTDVIEARYSKIKDRSELGFVRCIAP